MRRDNGYKKGRNAAKKEKIIMIASSAFVLMALTMTGVYVKNNNSEQKNDGYQINFDQLENQVKDELGNTGNQMQEQKKLLLTWWMRQRKPG